MGYAAKITNALNAFIRGILLVNKGENLLIHYLPSHQG